MTSFAWASRRPPCGNMAQLDRTQDAHGAGPSQSDVRNVVYLCKPDADTCGHESATQRALARQLADLRHERFGGDYEPQRSYGATPYFVPADTLDLATAARIGVRGEQDLFGGVVPHAFVATKIITHPLIAPDALAPPGWQPAFAAQVHDVVLPGYSAFGLADALRAGRRLLLRGAVRVKLAAGAGGLGQEVARDAAELESVLHACDAEGLLGQGVVLEQNLGEIATFSVGRARLGDLVVTYFGEQRLTPNNAGKEVYGGSDLLVVRGDFDVLIARGVPDQIRTALIQARAYHDAALRNYAGLYASRCNYDIARGRDEAGHAQSGVLEQSWRIGGASGAEIAAMQAFMHDPELGVVRASTTEMYGDGHVAPPGVTVYYEGVDPRVGRLLKYARIERDGVQG